jgi:hypothetical protein
LSSSAGCRITYDNDTVLVAKVLGSHRRRPQQRTSTCLTK